MNLLRIWIDNLNFPDLAAICIYPDSLRDSLIAVHTSQVAQSVKNLPAMQEIQVQSLSWEDPLEKGMATHSRILGLENPMNCASRLSEEAGR